jgi:hypothetical protein
VILQLGLKASDNGTLKLIVGLDEAEKDCCALKHAQKHGSLNCSTNAYSGWLRPIINCVEKRDPRRYVAERMPQTWKLDIRTRLEKRTFGFGPVALPEV